MRSKILTSAVFVGVLAACSPIVTGAGDVTSETRVVEAFTEIELRGAGTVILETGTDIGLEVEAEENILEVLETRVSGERLILGDTSGRSIRPKEPIVYRVIAPAVERLEVSGSGDIEWERIDANRLDARVSGSGSIVLTGSIDDLRVEIDGSGSVSVTGDGDQLRAEVAGSGAFAGTEFGVVDADVSVSGSGSAVVSVTGRLDVDISGSGSVAYIGEPERIESDISGSGSVSRR